MSELYDRQKSYEEAYDHKIIGRLPIIIKCDIRSGHKVTKQLERPFSEKFQAIMASTMLQTIIEMDGAVFGYYYADQITYILLPGDDPWYLNKIQKLSSIASSLTSVNFMKLHWADDSLNLDGDVIFDGQVWAVPSLNEVINNIILQQQEAIHSSITLATYSELNKRYEKNDLVKLLQGKKTEEKLELLYSECDVDYESYYPISYKRGICAYKAPKLFRSKDGDTTRNKWVIDMETPIFVLDKNFILNILVNGHDIFREERDLIKI